MNDLAPCPWCGMELTGEPHVREGSTFRWRLLSGCCTDGPEIRHDTMADDQAAAEVDSTQRAIDAWNQRESWRSIETAPKDGTLIDVFAEGYRFANVKWGQESDDSDGEPDPDSEFEWVHLDWHTTYDGWYWTGINYEPSHWMPVPRAPAGTIWRAKEDQVNAD
jgi:hypothetical protein